MTVRFVATMRLGVIVAATLGVVMSASAQQGDPPGGSGAVTPPAEAAPPPGGTPTPAPPAPAAATPAGVRGANDPCPEPARSPQEIEAQVLYEKAVRLQVDGQLREARELYQQIVSHFPETPHALAAKAKLTALDAGFRGEPSGMDTSGRVELIIGDSFLWLGYGMAAPLVVTDDADNLSTTVLWTGLGAGVVAGVTSTLLTRKVAVPDGWSHLHLFSQAWGSLNAAGVYVLVKGSPSDTDYSARAVVGSVLGGGSAGLLTSVVLKDWMTIPRGRAEFITSASLWASIVSVSAMVLATGDDTRLRPTVGTVMGAGNLALVTSALYAPPWTKSRVRLVSLMGFGGVVLGDAVLASIKSEEPRAYGGVTLGCTLVGLGVGVLVTSGMADASPAAGRGLPLPAMVSYDGELDWGVPVPKLVPSEHRGRQGMGVAVDLLAGRF